MYNENQEQVPICYACGKAIEPGQTIFAVKRLRVARKAMFFDEEHVLEAMVSIQVCEPCLRRAAKEALLFQVSPLPLLDLEKQYFHNYARLKTAECPPLDDLAKALEKMVWLTDLLPIDNCAKLSEEKMECLECHRDIEVGETYAMVQLVRAEDNGHGYEDEGRVILRILCDDCAAKMGVLQELGRVRRLAFGALASKKKVGRPCHHNTIDSSKAVEINEEEDNVGRIE